MGTERSGRLACQSEVTADARDLYSANLEAADCDACWVAMTDRGLALPLAEEDPPGEMLSLARSALALGMRAEPRSIAPPGARGDSQADGPDIAAVSPRR